MVLEPHQEWGFLHGEKMITVEQFKDVCEKYKWNVAFQQVAIDKFIFVIFRDKFQKQVSEMNYQNNSNMNWLGTNNIVLNEEKINMTSFVVNDKFQYYCEMFMSDCFEANFKALEQKQDLSETLKDPQRSKKGRI